MSFCIIDSFKPKYIYDAFVEPPNYKCFALSRPLRSDNKSKFLSIVGIIFSATSS
jgi:hypothetical protein